MAINMNLGGGFDNEYIGMAEQARAKAEGKKSKGGGGGSFIAGILDALGIHRQVAKGPKPGQTDLGTQQAKENAEPRPQAITNDEGEVTQVVTPTKSLLDQAALATGVSPLPMTYTPSNQGVPRTLTAIDPDLGMAGIIKPLGLK